LVDTSGQRLSRRDELLGINGYLAHLAKALAFARARGHLLLALVYGEAVSGGFLSFGMMADYVYALRDAQVRVMNLAAMARVTKI
ncbi:biotin-independent malonate decarboxylase subunit gamma, partial [Pelomicrobium sp. G1]|uniref:biotin-independent malonate decarboxylase subunit gamma n=1 Tax=Pelomicrobium sp. G1 TaxID=3452920 RepID=UPI003F75FFB4